MFVFNLKILQSNLKKNIRKQTNDVVLNFLYEVYYELKIHDISSFVKIEIEFTMINGRK